MVKPTHKLLHLGLVAAVLATAACTGSTEPPVVETPTVTPTVDPTPTPVPGGTVWAWGTNESGELGDGSFSHQTCGKFPPMDCSFTPVKVAGLTDVIAVSGGRDTGYALTADGAVWAWGSNFSGQLGDGIAQRATQNGPTDERHSGCDRDWMDSDCSSTPVRVTGLAGVVAISGGYFESYALKSDGTVWAWGSNEFGQLGDDGSESLTHQDCTDGYKVWDCSPAPVQVPGLTGVIAISGGNSTGYA